MTADETAAALVVWQERFGARSDAFERAWQRYWSTATAPDRTRLDAWLQRALDRCAGVTADDALALAGLARESVARDAVGRQLEYVRAERGVCPLCLERFEGEYLDHIGTAHRVRPEPDTTVNNIGQFYEAFKRKHAEVLP